MRPDLETTPELLREIALYDMNLPTTLRRDGMRRALEAQGLSVANRGIILPPASVAAAKAAAAAAKAAAAAAGDHDGDGDDNQEMAEPPGPQGEATAAPTAAGQLAAVKGGAAAGLLDPLVSQLKRFDGQVQLLPLALSTRRLPGTQLAVPGPGRGVYPRGKRPPGEKRTRRKRKRPQEEEEPGESWLMTCYSLSHHSFAEAQEASAVGCKVHLCQMFMPTCCVGPFSEMFVTAVDCGFVHYDGPAMWEPGS
jgi:hypothetical protein